MRIFAFRLLSILLFAKLSSVFGQIEKQYTPLQNSAVQAQQLIDELKSASQIHPLHKKSKEFVEFHNNRLENQISSIEQGFYLFDGYYYPRLNKILEEIKAAQTPPIDSFVRVLVGRSSVPNAFCYGNGVLVMNLGLINRLQNDDQLAFVICHELAHQMLEHSNRGVMKSIKNSKSKAVKKQVKKINKAEYNRNEMYEKFELQRSLKRSKDSRIKEKQADSLGAELMKRTAYRLEESLNVLGILDEIDQAKYPDSIQFNKVFTFDDFVFQDKWLRTKEGLKVKEKVNQALVDSLKTHPDCDLRIKIIQNRYKLDSLNKHGVEEAYTSFAENADFELVYVALKNKRLSYALNKSLELLNVYPENTFLKTTVGICLGEIYLAMKDHTLRDYVPIPKEDYSYNYYRTLLLVDNIRFSEFKKLCLAYYRHELKDKPNSFSAYAYLNELYKIIEQPDVTNSDALLDLYPDGFYYNPLIKKE